MKESQNMQELRTQSFKVKRSSLDDRDTSNQGQIVSERLKLESTIKQNKSMKFLSIDSSLSNTGIAYGIIEGNEIKVQGIELLQTEKTKNKQVRASSDTIQRCQQTYQFIRLSIDSINPSVVFVETPSGSQNAAGMKSYGVTCQLIASLSPSPIQVTPTEVKMASFGKKTASKDDMIYWAYHKYPSLGWPMTETKEGLVRVQKKAEHMADAIAIAYAGIRTNEFQRIVQYLPVES